MVTRTGRICGSIAPSKLGRPLSALTTYSVFQQGDLRFHTEPPRDEAVARRRGVVARRTALADLTDANSRLEPLARTDPFTGISSRAG